MFIRFRGLADVMGVYKEAKKLGLLTWGREGKGAFEDIQCLGVWVNVKQNPGTGQMGRCLLTADRRYCV